MGIQRKLGAVPSSVQGCGGWYPSSRRSLTGLPFVVLAIKAILARLLSFHLPFIRLEADRQGILHFRCTPRSFHTHPITPFLCGLETLSHVH
jgi:hypothetical protein